MRARVLLLVCSTVLVLASTAAAVVGPAVLADRPSPALVGAAFPKPPQLQPKQLGGVVARADPIALPEPAPSSAADAPPPPTAPPLEPAPVDEPVDEPVDLAGSDVAARIDAAITESGASGTVGLAVFDPTGTVLYDRGGAGVLLPASTQKVVTAAAVLAAFGPQFRFTTRVRATAAPGADGVVAGDLVLVGDADPALASPTFAQQVEPDRPTTPLVALADAVVGAGVTRVTGGVLGDPTALADEPLASGWLPRYLDELDAAPMTGLTVDAGRQLYVEGGVLRARTAADPAAEAAAALTTLLRERGVVVDGGVGATRTPPSAPHTLGEVQSPPLEELLRWMVQESDNHMADQLFRQLGRIDGGDGTWAAAAAAAERVLEPLGLDWTGAVLADGSGLSRDDRLSAGFLAALDVQLSRSDLGATWGSLMAVSGESGTLRRRLLDTIATGRLRGKTGSLEDVRALAGAVEGPGGELLHFAVLLNDLTDGTTAAARRLQDLVVLELVAELHGCTRAPTPTVDPAAPPATASPTPDPNALPTYACAA